MTVRAYAERILLSNTLAEKLAPPPPGLTLDPPRRGSYRTPDLPGRPENLLPRKPSEVRTKLPSAGQLATEEHRATLLHFFCNHELLAVELMALALLKFPDAPDAFRRGLLHTLQEEQEHTRLYQQRMATAGIHFGEHTLSRMIWDLIAPMTSPIEYVSRLSLTFEQSNLDFANHYSKAFAQAGDQESADLLSRIYKDEIAHVGYGLKWLRRFKQTQQTDWDAWHNSLALPLSPIRAKAPEGDISFNEEGRRKAGFDDDFIRNLQLYHRSRGRTPDLHFFNPNCESHAVAAVRGRGYQPTAIDLALEQDLEALILANTHHEDIALMRRHPRKEHLATLKDAGMLLPEIVTTTTDGSLPPELLDRKLGGFRPWAWTPDTAKLFAPAASNPTPNTLHPWREALPSAHLSKGLVAQATELLELSHNESYPFTEFCEAYRFVVAHFEQHSSPLLLKPALACAGRGQRSLTAETDPALVQTWLRKAFGQFPQVVIEPLLPRTADFSALYEVAKSGKVRFLSYTALQTDSQGRYLGSTVAPKIGCLLSPEHTVLFHQPCIEALGQQHSAPRFYKQILPEIFSQLLPDYAGPVAVDAFFYQHPGKATQIRPIVEVNARCSMGRIAHNLRRKLAPDRTGHLTIHRTRALGEPLPPGLLLNDPTTAQAFLATWESNS